MNRAMTLPARFSTTAGSNANIRLLSDDYIEIGIAQADLIADAYKTNEDLRAIAGLYTETCQLVVRADSNIQTLDDLSGHTVSIGQRNPVPSETPHRFLSSPVCHHPLLPPKTRTISRPQKS